jgi:hypothetical protein
MPSIASRLSTSHPDPVKDRMRPEPIPGIGIRPPISPAAPIMSTTLRCPLPNLQTPSPDNLRQFYAGGSIPQYRLTPLPPLS